MHQVRRTIFENPTSRSDSDGKVLPILVYSSAMAAIIIILFLYETTQLYNIAGFFLLPVLGFLMYFTSVVLCIVLRVLVKIKPRCYITAIAKYHSVINVVLALLWILSLGTSIYSIICTIVRVQCAMEDLPDRQIHIAIGAYYIIKASFMLIQTILLSKFSKVRLKHTKLIQCFFVVILLTNTTAWIFNISHVQNITSVNSTHCYWNTPLSTKVIVPLHTIMLSIEQEYNILSVCVILSLFLRNTWDTYYSSSGDIQHNASTHWREVWKPSKRLVIFSIMSVLLNLPTLVICEMRNSIPYTSEYATIMLNIFLIFTILYGFHILRQIKQYYLNKEVLFDYFFDNDVVYIVCTSGAIMYAAIGISLGRFSRGIFDIKTIKYTLFLFENYYQTLFILYLKKFRGEFYKRLQFVLVFLLVSNLKTWLIFQFLIYSLSYSNGNEVLGPLHPAAKHTLYTLICIYRFQSCIYLYQFYKKERYEQTLPNF